MSLSAKPRRLGDASRCAAWLCVVGLSLSFLACQRQPPELGQVPDFELRDQAGNAVSGAQWRGRIWVAAFMFTSCPTICPKITKTMQDLQRRARARGLEVNWVSFSVDPEHDTPAVLRRYAAEHAVDLSNWSFLTGDSAVVRKTAEAGFKMALDGTLDKDSPHYGISHGSHLVLVGPKLQIRGYYRTLEPEEQQRLLADVAAL